MERDDGGPRWYEEWFDRDEYEIVYSHRDEEEANKAVDLVVRAAAPSSGDRIVDVGCGRGRHAIVFAKRGYSVTGVDLSGPSIRAARRRAKREDVSVDFRVGDMRVPLCEECFEGAVNLFTAFGYFEKEEEHQQAISAIARMLVPEGWFFQDFMNPAYVKENLISSDTRVDGDVEIEQHRALKDGRIRKEIILRRNGEEHRFSESVRLLTLDDFRQMYEEAGLALQSVFGDYEGRPFEELSPRMIMLSRRLSAPK